MNNYTIRKAVPADLEELTAFADLLYASLDITVSLPFDIDSTRRVLEYLINAQVALVLEYHGDIVGAVGGTVEPCFWNHNVKVGHQYGIYVLPRFRGWWSIRLHKAFRSACREKGAQVVYLMSPKILHNVWQRSGARPAELVFVAEV